MRVRKSMSTVAVVVSMAGLTAPAAYATDSLAPGAGAVPPIVKAQDHQSSSTDWLLIGVGTAGAITLAGAGAGVTRRARHGTATHGRRLRVTNGS